MLSLMSKNSSHNITGSDILIALSWRKAPTQKLSVNSFGILKEQKN
jgi:hypothetical protein